MAMLNDTLTSTLSKVFPELSSTEAHVLLFYCSGFTVEEISERFIIGKKTVNSHLSNIKSKYEISTCFELRTFFYIKILSLIVNQQTINNTSTNELYPNIDIDICNLLMSGRTTREIAIYTNQTVDAAKAAEHRIYNIVSATNPKNLRSNFLLKMNESLINDFA
ncbi:TPA: helix-turn-helix transcriptional regulator [Salmonella enterica]